MRRKKRQWPAGMRMWPERIPGGKTLSAIEVREGYKKGLVGAWKDEEEDERFNETVEIFGGSLDGEGMVDEYGLAGSGAGQLSLSYVPAGLLWPGCMPGPPQRRGDCVSHGQKNACMISIAAEIMAGKPDEVTGEVEGPPEVSPTAIKQGVFSTEAIYWWRRHGGDGWSCSASARVVIEESGVWVRQPYTREDAGVDVDLTRYNANTAGKWGRTPPPNDVKKFGLRHHIRTATVAKRVETIRDMIANNYGINHCGSQGLSSKRDQHGVCRRSGSWAHAMAWIGFDDRPWAHQKYGGPLMLNLNSWGASWVNGPREVFDSANFYSSSRRAEFVQKGLASAVTGNMLIPPGSCWVRASDMMQRYHVASSSAKGWPPRRLSFHTSPFETGA